MRSFGGPPDLSAIKASYIGFAEPRTYEELRRLAHVQAGNAATFGFSALGDAARAVAIQLSEAHGPSQTLPPLIATWRSELQTACQSQ